MPLMPDPNEYDPGKLGRQEPALVHFAEGLQKPVCGIRLWEQTTGKWEKVTCPACLEHRPKP